MINEKTLLQMKNICKAFGDNVVLSNVELELNPGEVHILAGENGGRQKHTHENPGWSTC